MIKFPCWIIGLMSGTSGDGVDAALLFTDGKDIAEAGPSLTVPYSDGLRDDILGLMRGKGDLKATEQALTLVHAEAVQQLRAQIKEPIGMIGFHGQTIKHAPKQGITRQIGDARLLVQKTGVSVVNDFRTRDVKEGGQGAPLVPLYHAVMMKSQTKPLMVVNVGGVANITWLGANGEIIAFDCGPGNALIDDWVYQHKGERFDANGYLALSGKQDVKRVAEFENDPFFAVPPPKSLDRNHFTLDWVKGLSAEDGAATLTAMTATGIAKAMKSVPTDPQQIWVSGGGRHNTTLMALLSRYTNKEVLPVEHLHLNGDAIEAQAFAYLAARSLQGLALTLPTTTGVPRPVTGGAFYPAALAGASSAR